MSYEVTHRRCFILCVCAIRLTIRETDITETNALVDELKEKKEKREHGARSPGEKTRREGNSILYHLRIVKERYHACILG